MDSKYTPGEGHIVDEITNRFLEKVRVRARVRLRLRIRIRVGLRVRHSAPHVNSLVTSPRRRLC